MLLGYKYHFKKRFRPIAQWILAKKRGEEKEIISPSNRMKCFLKEHEIPFQKTFVKVSGKNMPRFPGDEVPVQVGKLGVAR